MRRFALPPWAKTALVVVLIGAVTLAAFAIARGGGHGAPQTITAVPCDPSSKTMPHVTVDLSGPATPAPTGIGTNIQQADELGPSSVKQKAVVQQLLRWRPSMARLHFGFHGDDYGSLPEGVQGQWDFTHLDAAVAEMRAINQPFFLNVRTAPGWMFDNHGNLRDPTFHEFATYMARLVGWYDKGGFTDDNGVFHQSGHQGWLKTWEIWNEPNSGYEIPAPVARPAATWMQPEDFARLYDVTVAAMRAVDPTIQTGGPTVSSYPDNPYMQTFVHDVTQPLDFVSFHFYAVGNQKDTDTKMFAEIVGTRLLDRVTAITNIVHTEKPNSVIPLWIDELGFDEIARLPVDARGTSPIAHAYLASVMTLLETHGITEWDEFPVVGNQQQGLVDYQDFHVYPIFWEYVQLSRDFPQGVPMVPATASAGADVTALAMLTPDQRHVRVLLGNTKVRAPTDNNGAGVPQTVCLALLSKTAAPKGIGQVTVFDAKSPTKGPPTPQAMRVSPTVPTQTTLTLTLSGYSATIVDLPMPS